MGGECPCCGGLLGNPLAGPGILVTCDGAPNEGEFTACTTCTIYEDFTPVDMDKRAWVERERQRLASGSAVV